jgi:hypothetical protein
MNEDEIEDMYSYHEAMANCVQCPYCLSDVGVLEINAHMKHCKEDNDIDIDAENERQREMRWESVQRSIETDSGNTT